MDDIIKKHIVIITLYPLVVHDHLPLEQNPAWLPCIQDIEIPAVTVVFAHLIITISLKIFQMHIFYGVVKITFYKINYFYPTLLKIINIITELN